MNPLARLLLAVLVPLTASAGVRFEFTAAMTDSYSYAGTMSVEGLSSRTDITSGEHPLFNPNFSIITRNAGRQIVVLDHGRRTWFSRNGDLIAGHLGTTRGLGSTTAGRPRVRSRRDDGVEIVTAEYTLRMNVEGEQLDATVLLEARFETAPALEQRALPWGLQYAAKTGYATVDRVVANHVPRRLPLRQIVKAARRIGDGPVIEETITTTVSNVVSAAIPETAFAVPDGYRYEEPSFVFGDAR
ncbi:MAG TPA: hypothetical protein VHK90_17120 [Thermoanaerobaculia bacterium]|nr:hypothetical protein [Thermoanaerobaculia bacterium]